MDSSPLWFKARAVSWRGDEVDERIGLRHGIGVSERQELQGVSAVESQIAEKVQAGPAGDTKAAEEVLNENRKPRQRLLGERTKIARWTQHEEGDASERRAVRADG